MTQLRALRRTLPDTNLASVFIAGGSPVAPTRLRVVVTLEGRVRNLKFTGLTQNLGQL